MTDRKFTPPTEFPAEYVDSNGDKAVILGRGPHKVFPFIGHNAAGYARYWTEKGTFSSLGINGFDIHDIPKHLNDQEDWDALQEVTEELQQAEARVEAMAGFIEGLLSGEDNDEDWRIEARTILAELKGETE